MSGSRLISALDGGTLTLPAGRIAVFGAPEGYDLSPLAEVTIITHSFPATRYWQARGYETARKAEGTNAAALVILPRAKSAARGLIAEARAATTGPVLIDGMKTDGADSILKAVKKETEVGGVLSKSHGKLFWIAAGDFSAWKARPTEIEGGFVTRPGVFSADGPDKGSQLLADALPDLKGRVADLGAGWGYLSRKVLTSDAVTQVDLYEADAVALDCARENLPDPRATFHWADVTSLGKASTRYDAVVMNPPFHTGRAGDTDLGRAFIRTAASVLSPSGTVYMVANRHLPYEAELSDLFKEVTEFGGNGGFKLFTASKPHRSKG